MHKAYDLLIQQLGKEMSNFYFYKQIAAHFEGKNWTGFAKYFSDQADDEKEHFDKILAYLYKKQIPLTIPMAVMPEMPDIMNCVSIFESALAREKATTSDWNAIYEAAKGKYGAVKKDGKTIIAETDGCNPSVVETIAVEFIAIQDAEEEEAYNKLAEVTLAVDEGNLWAMNEKLKG